jgi:secreted trypsin-like serine protease
VVKGNSSGLGAHVVRIYAGHYCSGVAISRRAIVTARHCVSRRMRIVAGHVSIGAAGHARSATLDDGRHVSVSGDAAIVRLARPLPASVTPASIGPGDGDRYTIAGFGTASERHRAAFGTLREAHLVAAEPRALVDPNRAGAIGASACFGDSGGPVLRGTALIGVITRAAHPHPRIACGHLTRWAPIVATGEATGNAETVGAAEGDQADAATARPARRKSARRRVARLKRGQPVAFGFYPVPRE